ncbi:MULTISPECIES: condensation domain-containing protein [unclassified Micromonospora]|uniref:condensation domain-containing protein n=1 Tax=unclassified Micromonospora TaxID=2617518 RepID=UPI00363CB3D1
MSQPKHLARTDGQYPLALRQQDPTGAARAPEDVLALTLRVQGPLRVDCLKGALEDVVTRHEALRTRIQYDEEDGSLGYQEVLPPLPVPLTVVDAVAKPGRSRDEIAVDLANLLATEGMPYTLTPSVVATLHRFDDHDAVLTLLVHHLYIDGWSAGILQRELAVCYRARATGIPHTLPAPAPFREFATWQQEFLQSEKAAAARRFWLDNLAGAELCTVPADRLHGPDTQAPQCAVSNFALAPERFARVTASAAKHRCSVWHVLLASVMAFTEEASGRTDITLLTVSSGRPARAFYDTIGLFADLVPVRLRFADCTTYLDLMRLARKASAEALQHQLPIGLILGMFPGLLEAVGDPRALVPGFNYISVPVAGDETKFTVSFEQVHPPEELPGTFLRGAFKWNFRVVPPGELRCAVEYEPDAVDASTIERWGTDFIDRLLAMADDPGQPWKRA